MVVKCFGFSPATSLQDFHYHKIIRTEIRERGNDGGSYTIIYESPFTANSAGPFFAADICKNRN